MRPIMKIVPSKSILTILLTLTFLTPVYAEDEASKTHIEQGIGFGSGATIGSLVAGPIGVVTGALVGSLIGQNVANENEVSTLINSNRQMENNNNAKNEAIKILEEQNAKQSIVLNQAHRTIEKLYSQNQELKNHALNLGVQFRTNSIYIEEQYRESLKDLAMSLETTPNLEIEISGFADRMGDEDYNMQLSNQRAKQVKSFLIEQGIVEDRITTLAHGETQPLHSEENLENNFFDRRVSVVIFPKEISVENIAEEIANSEKELSVAIK